MSATDDAGYTTGPIKTTKTPRVGKSFSSRNPLPIGAIGLVFILVLLYAAFNAESLPLIGGGTQYHAMFTDSANLKSGDDVRIAGVKSGQVDDVEVDTKTGDVKVTFTIKDGFVGDHSNALIKLRTLLGAKYLEIDSTGDKSLNSGGTIPIKDKDGTVRTEVPSLDVYPAFTALTDTAQDINTTEVADALRTLANDFRGTSPEVKGVVTGLSRISDTISSRDAQLKVLLSKAKDVTKTLSDRDADIKAILQDGNLLLNELNTRREAIHSLLINTQVLSLQLQGLVADNQKTLGPTLDSLNTFIKTLQDNEDSLDRGLALLGPFYRVFNNVIGNGRWFDNYIQNLSGGGIVGLLTSGLTGG